MRQQVVRHTNPNPSYRGGNLAYVRDFVQETMVVDGKAVTTSKGKHVVVNAMIRYTNDVKPSKSDPTRSYGYAYAQLEPGKNVGITGYDAMAPVISQLIDGQVYSFAGSLQYRDGNAFFTAEKLVTVGGTTADKPAAPKTRKTKKAAAPSTVAEDEVPFN